MEDLDAPAEMSRPTAQLQQMAPVRSEPAPEPHPDLTEPCTATSTAAGENRPPLMLPTICQALAVQGQWNCA